MSPKRSATRGETCRGRSPWAPRLVVLLYLGLNTLYIYAVPIDQIGGAQQSEIAMVAADRLLGPLAAQLLGAVAIVVLLASLSAMTIAGPRVYFAMARDGAFFPVMARIHPRFHTPWVAIAAQTVWSALLILTDKKDQLAEYTGFAVLLFSAIAVSVVFVLRRRHPDEPRPFKAWGYPVGPAVFVLASLAIMAAAISGRPGGAVRGVLIILAGIPVYYLFKRTVKRVTGSVSPAARGNGTCHRFRSAQSVTSARVPSAAAKSR